MSQSQANLDFLTKTATKGDRSALDALLVHFCDPLLHYIAARIKKYGVVGLSAEDVLQETFMQACESIQSLEPTGSVAFFAWLKTIARTRMINLIKARQAKKRGGGRRQVHAAASDATVTTLINLVAGPGPTPSRIVRSKETHEKVGRALAGLQERPRQVLELRFGQGHSIEQIASSLGLAEGAVKMIIHRALKELRHVVAPHGGMIDSSV